MDKLNEIFDNNPLWQMSYAERSMLLYLLSKMNRKKTAIEVGSYRGGFLQILSRNFDKVYSLDIDHSNLNLINDSNNIELISGNSKMTIPNIIRKINGGDDDVNFILIDANHSYEAVLEDINNILKYVPKSETYIFVHDSWYEPSRKAICAANWSGSEYVHYVECDFVVGDMIDSPTEGRIFVGGLAMAYMSNVKRKVNVRVEVKRTNELMYEAYMGKISKFH